MLVVAVLGPILAVVSALLLISPAAAVGLGPDWLVDDPARTLRISLGVAMAALIGAAVLASRRGRPGLAGLLLGVALLGLPAMQAADRLGPEEPPAPRGCVVHSGGRNDCPGG